MLTLRNILDVVICKSYIEVFTAKDSEDHTIRFFGPEDDCPENLKDMEVLAIYANGETDDECLYIEIDGSYCVHVIGRFDDGWETVSSWENLLKTEAMELFENIESNYSFIFPSYLIKGCAELEIQLWDDGDVSADAMLVSSVQL